MVARLCRPFTVLGARLAALRDTTLLVLEPSVGAGARTARAHDLRRGRWQFSKGPAALFDALKDFNAAAARERERLNIREVPLRSPASAELREAAARAWESLPAAARDAVLAARTVICMPAAAAGLDRMPIELLLHEGGWLGSTHVVARCPSFQYLEQLVAPNSRRRVPPARANGRAGRRDRPPRRARRGRGRRGDRACVPHRCSAWSRSCGDVAGVDDARTLFAGTALVHYVGHGFASELGEWLPVSADDRRSRRPRCVWPEDEDAPAVFFNACLVGRVRHISGGRQKGWAITLLSRGSPAVIGALAGVPDTRVPADRARDLPRRVVPAPLGEALRRARERLEARRLPPAARRRVRAARRPERAAVAEGCCRAPPDSTSDIDRALAGAAHALSRDAATSAATSSSRARRRGRPPSVRGSKVDRGMARAHRAPARQRPRGRGRAPHRPVHRTTAAARSRRRRSCRRAIWPRPRSRTATRWRTCCCATERSGGRCIPDESEALAATTEARLRMLGAERALVEWGRGALSVGRSAQAGPDLGVASSAATS